MLVRLLLASLFILGIGCSAKKKVLSEDNSVTAKGAIKVWANWVKDKKKKFDVRFVMENIRDKAVIVKLHDIQCARGKRTGKIQHAFFNAGERTIDLMPGETKQFTFVCKVGVKSEGPFNIRINRVYDNPEEDGATTGKIIAKSVIWSQPDK